MGDRYDLRRWLSKAYLRVGSKTLDLPEFLDLRDYDWELTKDTPRTINSVKNVELATFNKTGITGKAVVRRAEKELAQKGFNAKLGQEDAKWLLMHSQQIPAEFCDYVSAFIGTIWKAPDGDLYVPCIVLEDMGWHPCLYRLEDSWRPTTGVVCLRTSVKK